MRCSSAAHRVHLAMGLAGDGRRLADGRLFELIRTARHDAAAPASLPKPSPSSPVGARRNPAESPRANTRNSSHTAIPTCCHWRALGRRGTAGRRGDHASLDTGNHAESTDAEIVVRSGRLERLGKLSNCVLRRAAHAGGGAPAGPGSNCQPLFSQPAPFVLSVPAAACCVSSIRRARCRNACGPPTTR